MDRPGFTTHLALRRSATKPPFCLAMRKLPLETGESQDSGVVDPKGLSGDFKDREDERWNEDSRLDHEGAC